MRFYGEVGYGLAVETRPGVWKTQFEERPLFGTVERDARALNDSDKVNDDISVSHTISVLADAYALAHYANIKYVVWSGVRWTVTSVENRRPRLLLRLGGVYNGNATPIAQPVDNSPGA